MIDLLYVTHNRFQFTVESLKALNANTDWQRVRQFVILDDGSIDGTREMLSTFSFRAPVDVVPMESFVERGPVAAINWMADRAEGLFAKVDNDTMVPPGWIEDGLEMLARYPDIDLLGIEAWPPDRASASRGPARVPVETQHIGGIGFFRCRAFAQSRPVPNLRNGFTEWQRAHPEISKAWIDPSLQVFLLDRLPFEPWRSYSMAYEKQGWQRPWRHHSAAEAHLWSWWRTP